MDMCKRGNSGGPCSISYNQFAHLNEMKKKNEEKNQRIAPAAATTA